MYSERLEKSESLPASSPRYIRRQSDASSLFIKEIKLQHKELLETIRKYEPAPGHDQIKQFSSQLEATAELSIENQFAKLILAHLEFTEIQDRYERICPAHRMTFEWIFKEPDDSNAEWDDFSRWLSSQEEKNFYWITGKAGSGKSTLMKHIYDHDQTLKHLETWAAQHQLLTAGFFFWNSGYEIQMSGIGLLRTLLYQILKQQPRLAKKVFRKRWEAYQTLRGGFYEWTWLDLKQSLEELARNNGIRLALFIDGLDEFDGHHDDLVELLLRISGPTVKVCAASRPWLVFEDAFENKPNLLLEHLTRKDIRLYVNDAFGSSKHFAKLQRLNPTQSLELTESVVNKASGVFLWVNLVVRSLLQGMANADRMSDLKRRLDSLPTDLEDLFDKLLRSLEPFYFPHAAQLIQILKAAPVPPTPLEMSYADEEEASAAIDAEIRPWTGDEVIERSEAIRRRLNSRCKGLIAVSQYGSSNLERVEFLHRTVKDFFDKSGVWDTIIEVTPEDFDPIQCWANSILMELKTSDPDSILPADLFRLIQWGIQHIEQSESATRNRQTNYLDELDRTIKELTARNSTLRMWNVPEYFTSGTCFLDLVFQHGMIFYVQERLQDTSFTVEDNDLDILRDTVENSASPGSADIIKLILQRRDVDNLSLSQTTTLGSHVADIVDEYKKGQLKQKQVTGSSKRRSSWWRDRQLTNQIATKIEGFWSL